MKLIIEAHPEDAVTSIDVEDATGIGIDGGFLNRADLLILRDTLTAILDGKAPEEPYIQELGRQMPARWYEPLKNA